MEEKITNIKLNMYVMYDRKSGQYAAPFTHHNDATAKRYFEHICSNPSNAEFALDIELYKVGNFDVVTGVIDACEKPEYLCNYGG